MSKDFLLSIFEKVKEKGIIDDDLIKYLERRISNKLTKVFETIKRGITKCIYYPSERVIWIAMGENKEYLIYPMIYCSCKDFYKNIVIKRKRTFCKHILAQIICEALNIYKKKTFEDVEFKERIREMKLKY
ncbi:MAG: hypothetical protein ACTSPD_03435 [Promethearchaeota archaeon]